MELINDGPDKGKFIDFRPSRLIKEGITIVEIEGEAKYFQIIVNVDKVYQIVEKGGQPIIRNGGALYNFKTSFRFIPITRDEYNKIQQSKFDL